MHVFCTHFCLQPWDCSIESSAGHATGYLEEWMWMVLAPLKAWRLK